MAERVSDERLGEMLAGLEGVTPGPWFTTGSPWFQSGDGVMAGSPDPHAGFLIADCDDGFNPRDEYEGYPLGDADRDAAHIARCDPDTMRSILTELVALRKVAAELAKAYDQHYDPGVSDLDNEQPVAWHLPLGTYRTASAFAIQQRRASE